MEIDRNEINSSQKLWQQITDKGNSKNGVSSAATDVANIVG
jgi:hypothetical protein